MDLQLMLEDVRATSCGVRLADIRQHVLENVDGLNKISLTKIYYLLKPAHSNSKDAARHKDALDIRVGTKACDSSKDNVNAHEYFAQVSNVRQMCELYQEECVLFSCDSKAKIHIGGQAVSRYHQLKTFFPSDDVPHYADHDFPVPGYLIEPDGYLMLQSKHNPAKFVKDKMGREVVDIPATGPLWVYNRCVKNTSTSIADHVKDIHKILEENENLKKPALVLVTDGGPDWSPKSNINQFFLGRLWRKGNFDVLISVCEPAGLSRFNPIEHLWSPLSRFLAGVQLPSCLPGETIPPAQQNIEEPEKSEKERQVFDNALDRLNTYWDGKVHDGFRITSKAGEQSGDTNVEYNAVKDFFHSSLRALKEPGNTDLLEEWKYLSNHMERRRGLICFRKNSCGDPVCECMASSIPASEVSKLPISDQWLFPPITPDPGHPEHYMTFHQLQVALAFSRPDQHMKDGITTQCSNCRYVFTSKTDEDRHNKIYSWWTEKTASGSHRKCKQPE